MFPRYKNKLLYWVDASLHSYSQVFFSQNKIFAVCILLVSFLSPQVGLSGLSAVILINLLAQANGFPQGHIRDGLYGFNALLLGLALGYEYKVNFAFFILFAAAIALLLVFTVWLNGYFEKQKLPFLSFPFLLTYWIVAKAASAFAAVQFDDSHVYVINQAMLQQGSWMYAVAHCLDGLYLPNLISVYFRTLAGTFFQDSIFGGALIAAGLLFFSRIAFSLSLLGLASAYLFYNMLGADTAALNNHLVGSNFIFMAIAIGCFYVVPGGWSYLFVVALTPLLLFLLVFADKALQVFQLKAFTLSFSVMVTVFLFFLHRRWLHKFLHLVTVQYYSAETTIYKHLASVQRFRNAHFAKVYLPFWGEWMVSQGHEGKITHLGDWSKAFDFVICDNRMKTYRDPGAGKNDFYCFGKPVLAPLDGYIYDIVNTVDDNDIAQVNTGENWGNTIIINHLNGLFSQISHLKKDSMKVSIGEYVKKGTIIAGCGNSGRSPEPHIHFQLQTLPKVGAKTLAYPLAYFIERENNKQALRVAEVPREGTLISNVETTPDIVSAFDLTPGKKIIFHAEHDSSDVHEWEVLTDAWNRSYIYCRRTKSLAYFVNDGTMFSFTDFEGRRNSLLFRFYLAAYRVLLADYEQIRINDQFPLHDFSHPGLRWMQDFLAPVYRFTKAGYESHFSAEEKPFEAVRYRLKSKAESTLAGKRNRSLDFELDLLGGKIRSLKIRQNENTVTYVCAA